MKNDPLAQFILLALVVFLVLNLKFRDDRSVLTRVKDAFAAAGEKTA